MRISDWSSDVCSSDLLSKIGHCRILLGSDSAITNSLYGGPADIAARGKLQGRWLAKIAVEWLSKHAEVRHVPTAPPQSMIIISENRNRHVLTGTCGFTTDGLGVDRQSTRMHSITTENLV